MNIKKIYLPIIFFFNIIFIQIKSTTLNNFEIVNTPSKLNAVSLNFYFQNLNPYIETLNSDKNQQLEESQMDIFDQSLSEYIKDIYNNKYYNNFLSQNGSHILQLLKLINKLNLSSEYMYTSIRLFYNKIKSCEIIDDTVTIQILKPLPKLLEKYFTEEELKSPTTQYLSQNIEKVLLYKLTDHYQEFSQEPDSFISNLSSELGNKIKTEFNNIEKVKEKKEMKHRLQQLIIKFIEILLTKTFWTPEEFHSTWDSVLSIAYNIQRLALLGIIDHMDDLDDLFWSLTYRFCYFLEIAGSFLPRDFFEKIEDDINNQLVIFLELEEQDEDITSKKETILRAIFKAKSKAIAFEKGILTDQMMAV